MQNFLGRAGLHQEKRQPAFAGTWYESDASKLRNQLEQFLDTAHANLDTQTVDRSFDEDPVLEGQILAAIAPHAGYMFSGQTAAFAYDRARQHKVDTVFLLGPSHYVGFQGAALPSEKYFSTPLGDIAVDTEIVTELANYPAFTVMPAVHKREHSLEMQLPLIKQALGDVKIVPVIVGTLNDETEIRLMAQILRRYVKATDIVVVSSDFTHYGPRYQYQPFKGNVSANVRKLDHEAFKCLRAVDLEAFLDFRDRTDDTICGFFPIAVLLAMLPDGSRGTLLNYKTSRDSIMEDDNNSVSYLSIVFSDQVEKAGWPAVDRADARNQLSTSDKEKLLKIARLSLNKFVIDKRQPDENELDAFFTPGMKVHRGAFVTLYKKLSNEVSRSTREFKELRGCIGYIWPVKSLLRAVVENAVGAASRDYRFVPVVASELSDIQIDINVLTPPRRVDSWQDIVIGRDGIVLYKAGKQAVFLPSVATDFGWDLEQTLSQLSQKAGCGADGWRQGAHFDVFQSESIEESD